MNLIEFQTLEEKNRTARKQELVDTLTRLLERAEDGSITGIAYATVSKNNEIGTGWAGFGRAYLGFAVGQLFHRYMAAAKRPD